MKRIARLLITCMNWITLKYIQRKHPYVYEITNNSIPGQRRIELSIVLGQRYGMEIAREIAQSRLFKDFDVIYGYCYVNAACFGVTAPMYRFRIAHDESELANNGCWQNQHEIANRFVQVWSGYL